MSKKLSDRTPIVTHRFKAAVYHPDRCQHCGHGMPYQNPDTSPVHEQELARLQAETTLKMPQRAVEYYPAYEAAADKQATVNAAAQPPLITEFAGQEMRERVAFVAEQMHSRGPTTALVDVPVRVWERVRTASAAQNYTMQGFVNELITLIDGESEYGHQGMLDISAAHRADMRTFRQHVANTAVKYAITHDWCDEVLACLDEIGIKLGPMHVKVSGSLLSGQSGSSITAHLLLPYDEIPVYRKDPMEWCEHHLPRVEVHDAVLENIEILDDAGAR